MILKLPEVLVVFINRPRVPNQVRIDEEGYAIIKGKKVKIAKNGSFQWTGENDKKTIKVPGSIVNIEKTKVVNKKEITVKEKHLIVPFHLKTFVNPVQQYENDCHAKGKMHGHVKFELELSLKAYLDDEVFKDAMEDEESTYVLQGFNVHQGIGSTEPGHFVSFIRPFYTNNWLKFDDYDPPKSVSEKQVMKEEAYMLMYYKKRLQPKSFPIPLNQFGACMNKCNDFVIDVDDGSLSKRLNFSERLMIPFVESIEDDKEYSLRCVKPGLIYPDRKIKKLKSLS